MRNYFNYYTEVEEFFLRKRRKNLMVSPLDWCLIELWKENGIPLHVVLRGIERSFDSTSRNRRRSPTTLFYCHPAVMEAFGEYQEAMLGASEAESSPEDEPAVQPLVLSHMDRLLAVVREHPQESVRLASKHLKEVRAEVVRNRELGLEEIDRALRRIVGALVERSLDEMSSQERRSIKKKVRDSLRIYKKRISKEMYSQMEASYLQRVVLEELGVPDFSLLRVLEDS